MTLERRKKTKNATIIILGTKRQNGNKLKLQGRERCMVPNEFFLLDLVKILSWNRNFL